MRLWTPHIFRITSQKKKKRITNMLYCICDGTKMVLIFARTSWPTNHRGFFSYNRCSPLFHLFMVLQRGFCAVEWMTQCSQNKLALIWVCAHIWIGLIHCVHSWDSWTATPRNLCQHQLWHTTESITVAAMQIENEGIVLLLVFGFPTLAFQFPLRWPTNNENCVPCWL